MKSKICIIIAMTVVAAVACAVFVFGKDDSNVQSEKLLSALEYYEKCDYDNAIALYNAIISDDDTCAEAYLGLADAYWAKENTDKALQILEKGLDNTDNDESVLKKMKELFPNFSAEAESEVTVTVSSAEQTEVTVTETEETASETSELVTETETSVTTEATTVSEIQTVTEATTTSAAQTTTAPVQTTTNTTTAKTTVASTTTAKTTTAETTTTTAEEKKPMVEVPDFTNMTYDEAYLWCSFNSLRIKGIGLDYFDEIKSQSPAPGTLVEEDSVVIVKG